MCIDHTDIGRGEQESRGLVIVQARLLRSLYRAVSVKDEK